MSARGRQVCLVVTVAVAALALAVALAVLTSHLTSQHVGLAGEPPRPATGLVVPARTRPAHTTPTSPASPVHSEDANERSGDD